MDSLDSQIATEVVSDTNPGSLTLLGASVHTDPSESCVDTDHLGSETTERRELLFTPSNDDATKSASTMQLQIPENPTQPSSESLETLTSSSATDFPRVPSDSLADINTHADHEANGLSSTNPPSLSLDTSSTQLSSIPIRETVSANIQCNKGSSSKESESSISGGPNPQPELLDDGDNEYVSDGDGLASKIGPLIIKPYPLLRPAKPIANYSNQTSLVSKPQLCFLLICLGHLRPRYLEVRKPFNSWWLLKI